VIGRSDHDLALLRVAAHESYKKGYSYIEVEPYENIHEGDEIATRGFPLGDFLEKALVLRQHNSIG
jgi:hypothetical protein